MKTLTADQLRKHALSTGSELEMGGARFNSGREQVLSQAPRLVPLALPVVAPVKPSEPALTRADVDALLTERDAVWRQQIEHLTEAFAAALKAVQPNGKARVSKFNITYDKDKCVTSIVPVYAQ